MLICQTITLILLTNPNHMSHLNIKITVILEFTQFTTLQQIMKIHPQSTTQRILMITLQP